MHPKVLGDLVYRLDPTVRLKLHLSLELSAEILSLLFAHNLLLFTAGYHPNFHAAVAHAPDNERHYGCALSRKG